MVKLGEHIAVPLHLTFYDVFRRGNYKDLTRLKDYAIRMKFCQDEPFYVNGISKEAMYKFGKPCWVIVDYKDCLHLKPLPVKLKQAMYHIEVMMNIKAKGSKSTMKILGTGPYSRVLARKSRKQAEQYHRPYNEAIPVTQLIRETTVVLQELTQSGGVRPIGVSLLVTGFDDMGPQLYQVNPSGSYFSCKVSAKGKNVSNAKTILEKRYTDDMKIDDAVHTVILTLKEEFEEQTSGENIGIGIIGIIKDHKFLGMFELPETPVIAKRIALSWCWCVTMLVFDPGTLVVRRCLQIRSILEDKDGFKRGYLSRSNDFEATSG